MKLPKFEKPTKKQVIKFLKYCLIVVIGNAIAAAASSFFIIPNDFVMGGTTGVGIFVRNLLARSGKELEWVVTVTVYTANIALFILGAALLGKKFAAATAAGTLLYPTFLSLWNLVNNALKNPMCFPEEPLLGVIFGAIFFGLGIGIVVRVGASTGGTDIPPLILHKYFNFPVSVGMWGLDIAIVLLQFAAGTTVKDVLYGILIVLVSSIIVDEVSLIGMRRAQVKILSRKNEEIRKMILNKLNRGVTMLSAKTGFLKDDCYMLLTIISFRDIVKLRNEVHRIDPDAFVMISTISEVRGRGFSSDRIALPNAAQDAGERMDLTNIESLENYTEEQLLTPEKKEAPKDQKPPEQE